MLFSRMCIPVKFYCNQSTKWYQAVQYSPTSLNRARFDASDWKPRFSAPPYCFQSKSLCLLGSGRVSGTGLPPEEGQGWIWTQVVCFNWICYTICYVRGRFVRYRFVRYRFSSVSVPPPHVCSVLTPGQKVKMIRKALGDLVIRPQIRQTLLNVR